jgi:MFS transporter, OFA family, oxalate/formate antiporter
MIDTPPSTSTPLQTSRLVARAPFFYGWVVLAVGALGIIMTSPGQTYTVSIFVEHFITDLGLSRSLVSTLYALGTVAGSLALPFIGRAIDRHGSRRMVLLIAVLFGLACLYMGLAGGALTLALGFFAIRMLGQGGLGLVSQNAINQWWVRRRGLALGLSGLFASLLGLGAFPALVNWLIPQIGWRLTYAALGALLLLVMAPLGYLFFRDRPEDFGLRPDGAAAPIPSAARPFAASLPLEENWTRAEALRTPVFWLVAAGLATLAMMGTGLFFHMVSIFAGNGLSPTVAASVYLPIAVTTALLNLGSGALVDRIQLRSALAAALFLQALALWMAQHLATVPLAFLYGIVLGASSGLARTLGGFAWATYFGRAHLGSISGVAATLLIFGAALGPLPLGYARDLLGSYDLALTLLATVPLALGVASLFLRPPRRAV